MTAMVRFRLRDVRLRREAVAILAVVAVALFGQSPTRASATPSPPAWLLTHERLLLQRGFRNAKPAHIDHIWYPKRIGVGFEFSQVVVCNLCEVLPGQTPPHGRVIRADFSRTTHWVTKYRFCSARRTCLTR